MSAGRTVCSTSVVLPAVPTAKRYSPARTRSGPEDDLRRADLRAVGDRVADLHRGLDGGEMLAQQAGLLASGADVHDAKRLPRDERQRERGAQDLPPALARGAVDR